MTVTTGLVIKAANDLPVVQISLPSVQVVNMPLLFVDGVGWNISEGFQSENVTVSYEEYYGEFRSLVSYPSEGISVKIRFAGLLYIDFDVQLPPRMRRQDIVGLLGSPNGNRSDDWMDREGNILPGPQSPWAALFQPAYEYCTQNW